MLLTFYCSNFKSINEEIKFDMFAGNYKRHENHMTSFRDKKVLRSSAIYGANGSGKTNLLLALKYLQDLITNPIKDVDRKLRIPGFKLTGFPKRPTKFDIHFLSGNKRYNYILEITDNAISMESLFEIIASSSVLIFRRKIHKGKTKLTVNPNRKKSNKEKYREEFYAEELSENQTFFSDGYNRKIEEMELPYKWFSQILNIVSFASKETSVGLAHTFLTDESFLNASREFIRKANVGIADFSIVKHSRSDLKSLGYSLPLSIEEGILDGILSGVDFLFEGDLYSAYKDEEQLSFAKISTIHQNESGELVTFRFSEESKGTQRLFELLPAIHHTLHKGEVFVIDELETSFHPVLIKEVLSLYFNSEPRKAGQIIFTTHESHLLDLDLFRQDEIWFCEKDKTGASKLNSLAEFKPRFDKEIRRGYLNGQFSYIPFLASHSQLEL